MESRIKVLYDGQDVTRFVENVAWSGSTSYSDRKVDVSLINTRDGRNRSVNIEEGKELVFYSNDEEIFKGVIFSDFIKSDGTQTLTAYDENIYLAKNSETIKIVKKKASDIVTDFCNKYGIEVGKIADTGFVIPKIISKNKFIYEIINEALDITYKQNGRKFYLTNENGKVTLVERSNNAVDFSIENAKNILSASYSKSIEDTRTQVNVVAGDVEEGTLKVELARAEEVSGLYGIMQHVEEVSPEMTRSEMKQRAQELIKQLSTIKDDATIEALGDNRIKSGVLINVKESMTGLIGTYYVVSDTHYFENVSHIMSLTISANDA